MQTYVDNLVRHSSMGASYKNMCILLNQFDPAWSQGFKNAVNAHPYHTRLINSAKSLANNRNQFAHGKNVTVTINDITDYYNDCLILINMFDSVVR